MTVRFVRLCFIESKAEAPSSTDSDDDDDDDDPTAFTQKTETERWSVGEQVCPKRETEARQSGVKKVGREENQRRSSRHPEERRSHREREEKEGERTSSHMTLSRTVSKHSHFFTKVLLTAGSIGSTVYWFLLAPPPSVNRLNKNDGGCVTLDRASRIRTRPSSRSVQGGTAGGSVWGASPACPPPG